MKMMNPTKINHTFMGYFVLFVWGFVLMEVGLGQNPKSEIKVGVVLDLKTNFSKICLTFINMSLSDFYEKHADYNTRLAIHVRDSAGDVVQASAAALDLIKNEKVSAIIGPRTSTQAEFMIKLANKSQVPTITFSATSPLLTSIHSTYFVRATVNDLSQVKAIAAIVKSFRWRSVVAIYVDNEFGEGIMPYLSDALQDVHALVVYRSVISMEANDDQIEIELFKLMTMQTRVFVAHMHPSLGFRVIQKAREIGMMDEGYVWLFTDGMMNWIQSNEPGSNLENLQGVLGVRSHVPKSKELKDFGLRWKRKFEKDVAKPNVFALWAYDSITALAMAVEKRSIESLWYDNAKGSSNNKTDLGNLGVSHYGPSLLKALSDVRFKGLAGEFKLIDRQLESSTFEIINIIENEEKVVGFWNKTTSFSGERFRPVIWPGKPRVTPKGWEIPTKGKKLRVGVPVKRGFLNFVDIKTDLPTGYCIDVFEAALTKLPYSVIPQYFRFESPDENYDDVVQNVYNGTWDAAAGDITIRANRSLLVDFTVPYTESGVFMLVPLRDNESKNTWVFLKPWSLDLWVTTACFFVFIGFIVWILEHRVNTDFRGPPHHQIGTSFWFSFSTMNFAHQFTKVAVRKSISQSESESVTSKGLLLLEYRCERWDSIGERMEKACVVVDDRLFVIGGQEGDFMAKPGSPIFKCSRRMEVVFSDVYMLDEEMKWKVMPSMPKPDSHIELAWKVVNNSIVIVGGTTEKHPETKKMVLVGEIFQFNLNTMKWYVIGKLPYRVKTTLVGFWLIVILHLGATRRRSR